MATIKASKPPLPEPEAIPEVNVDAPLQNMISLQDLNKAIENAVAAYKEAEAQMVLPEDGVLPEGESLEEMEAGPVVNISIPSAMGIHQPMQPQIEDTQSELPAQPQMVQQQPQMVQQPVVAPAMMSMPGGPMMGGAFQYVDEMPIVQSGMPAVTGGHQIINIDTYTSSV